MPLFEDAAFRALQSGLDAMWLKQQVASHNIANVETPDFKAKKVEFKQALREAADGNGPVYQAVVGTDNDTEARPGGKRGTGLMEGVHRVFGDDVPDVGKAFHAQICD